MFNNDLNGGWNLQVVNPVQVWAKARGKKLGVAPRSSDLSPCWLKIVEELTTVWRRPDYGHDPDVEFRERLEKDSKIRTFLYIFGDMTTDKNGNVLVVSKFVAFTEERYLIRLFLMARKVSCRGCQNSTIPWKVDGFKHQDILFGAQIIPGVMNWMNAPLNIIPMRESSLTEKWRAHIF